MANNEALRFPDWEEALAQVSAGLEYVVYKHAILGFLHHCKINRAPATVMLAKEYIEGLEKQGNKRGETTREALRWFVIMARKRGAVEKQAEGGKSQRSEIRNQGADDGCQKSGVGGHIPAAGESAKCKGEEISYEAHPAVPLPGLKVTKSDHAPMAASDLGGADWERDLIRAVREKGFLWRTERTYREWAARFADFSALVPHP